MGREIERKFLVKDKSFKQLATGSLYRQGYLNSDFHRVVRVRVNDNRGFITVKGKATGATRTEYEYEIPLNDANDMLNNLCEKPIIEKQRYKYEYLGFIWEIDEFYGENEGLVLAEIELEDENIDFPKPHWVEKEVTHDFRYTSSSLIKEPYKNWKPISG
ncbi:MAG: CYTH domain-containing protein [Clostridia bacterium]|nr:CYTH domain-containing protein [Clostridia bacterium]